MTAEELLKKPGVRPFWKDAINPKAVRANDRFMVVNMDTLTAVESFWGPESAVKAVNTFNEHETANGRPATYEAFTIER